MAEFANQMSAVKKKAAKRNRILVLDIERVPGVIRHEFWHLGDMKNRRFYPDEVVRHPRTICFSAAWYDKPDEIIQGAEWMPGGHMRMLEQLWELYDEADIVIGHNIRSFDTKVIKGDWIENGFALPSSWQTVDTLTIARREFNFESNTLDALCKRLGIPAKTDKYNAKVAQAACAGDVEAQDRILAYNAGDITATMALYDKLRPFIHGHPHLGLGTGDERCCPNCGGTKFTTISDARTSVTTYAARRCDNCKSIVRNSHMRLRATTRVAV